MVRILLLLVSLVVLGNSIPMDGPVNQHLLDNIQKIELHNANPNKTFIMRVNRMSSLSPEQYAARLGLRQPSIMTSPHNFTWYSKTTDVSVPVLLNWTARGIVNRVKDTGACGADWAFSAIGALEGQHAIQRGSKMDLSEQNLVDCSINGKNDGCQGGSVTDAYQYIMKNGVDTEQSYPYVGKKQSCQFGKDTVGETIDWYTLVPNDESYLENACAFKGPISVVIDANHASFQNYGGGIYYEPKCSATEVNLAMLLVGYNYDPATENFYWILKNSFGTDWGEQGYMRLRRDGKAMCGITTMASFPTI